jgi:drug/metabolite transporter (DMT)-like permease
MSAIRPAPLLRRGKFGHEDGIVHRARDRRLISWFRTAFGWLANQPYLLLSLTSLFWAGNIVLGRAVAGHVPPVTLSCVRWIGAMLLLLPIAWPHLRRDWRKLLVHWKLMMVLSATGFAINNALAYWGLQYTEALNALLMQSSGPLFVALWSLLLFGVRLTWMQAIGIALSLLGVLTIILRGDFAALAAIEINRGDLMIAGALCAFGLYSALMPKRPATHPLSLIVVTTGGGALLLLPFAAWEYASGVLPSADWITALTLAYVVIFPSMLAYLCFNRGVALIGPNRSAPFLHLMPVFGSVMAIALLGEKPELFHLAGYAMVVAGVFIAARR